MTTPFPFTPGQTLTAAQMNAITTLPSTTKVASHTLVIADQGTRVIMNSASATSVTVNTSIFGAGDIVEIQNIGVGVCTVTAGTATVSSAGPLAIPQNGGGRLIFSSASAATYFPTAVTALASGFNFISATSFTTATSVSLPNDTFTSTYANYRMIFVLTAVTGDIAISGRYRTSGTDNSTARYYQASTGFQSNNTSDNLAQATQTSFGLFGLVTTMTNAAYVLSLDFYEPNVNRNEKIGLGSVLCHNDSATYAARHLGLMFDNNNSDFQADSFSVISNTASSMTGTVRVYGYSNG